MVFRNPNDYTELAIKRSNIKLWSILFFISTVAVLIAMNADKKTVQERILSIHQYWSTSNVTKTITTKFLQQLQFMTLSKSDYYSSRFHFANNSIPRRSSLNFNYSETTFRSLNSPPILWLDANGDVRWNEAAEHEMLLYLSNKQIIDENRDSSELINDCLQRRLLIIKQHHFGFFSRYHCFIEQFGQTLYSPWMTLMSFNRFRDSGAEREDFLGNGILRYFEPISTCSKYLTDSRMKAIELLLRGASNVSSHATIFQHLLYLNQLNSTKYIILDDKRVWEFGYEHVPVRRWMFSRHSINSTYNLSVSILIEHNDEHIYRDPSLTDEFLTQWTPRNRPGGHTNRHLPNDSYILTWQDRVFTGFLRYIFVLYFHRFTKRIHQMTCLLADHWSSYLRDKYQRTLNDTAALIIRRGDKMPEDSFWQKHKRWRNISLYVKGLVDEEHQQNRKFTSVFIMTDDSSVMASIQDYANPQSKGIDEQYARMHLHNRQIMHNVFAPQACLDPFSRIELEQFLVSIEFIVQYVQFTVGHSDSNVGRYLEEITYSRNQMKPSVHSDSFIRNAPDTF